MNNGAFGEGFPYSNFHDLNTDWIIKIAKDFLDQYTHIQEVIANGEESLTNLTTEGIEQLQNKADELEGLLQEWYNTHSEDIANALASALDDLNAQLTLNTNTFNQRAEQKGQDVIASIPSDYTALTEKVANLIANNAFNILPKLTGSHTDNGVTFSWNANGSCTVTGTQSGGSSSIENIVYSPSILPDNFEAGKTYYVNFSSSNKMRLQVIAYLSDSSFSSLFSEYHSGQFTVPSDAIGIVVRLLVTSGSTVNETVTPVIRTALSNAELSYNQTDLRPEVEALQSDVADLKKHELTMNFSSATNLNQTSLWELGSISPVTGENVVNNERIRTISYLDTNIATIRLPDDTRGFFICGYEQDGTFLGVYSSNMVWTIDQGTGYQEFNFSEIYNQYTTARLRIYLYSRNGTPITLAEAEYIEMQSIYNQLIDPVTIRVMDYNVGGFNFGHDGGYSGNALGLKLSNYRKLINEYHPNVVCMQEYRPYVDSNNTANTDYIIFNYELPYKAFDQDTYPTYPYVSFMDYMPSNIRHTYLHTSGDHPVHLVYNSIVINNSQIAIGTCALNSLGGSDDASMKIRALTKMIDVLSDYETAIIGIDTNAISEAEANAIKTFMKSNGYMVANCDYIGYLPTYNPYSQQYKCIDSIFIKGKARFKHVEVVPTSEYNNLLSDHLPIIADILIYK